MMGLPQTWMKVVAASVMTLIVAVAHATPPAAPEVALLASGLQGATGSALGPGGALYVAEGRAGRISRIDPQTG